jgi:hypothetical protein
MDDRKPLSIPEESYVQIPNLRIEAVMFGLNASWTELDNFRSNFLPQYEDDDEVKLWLDTQTEDSYDLQLKEWNEWNKDVDDGF